MKARAGRFLVSPGGSVVAATAVFGAAIASSACSVGRGSGTIHGSLSVVQCTFGPDQGIEAPNYDLKPDFFVGEPLDSNPITAPVPGQLNPPKDAGYRYLLD